MMTSSNGNIFRVTGHSPVSGEFPTQRPVTRSFYVFFDLRRNLSSLQTYLNNVDIQFTVIGISETWLKPYNVDCYGMDGYKEEHLYRSERMGGGVSLYVMNGIEYFVRNDMSIIDEHLESIHRGG